MKTPPGIRVLGLPFDHETTDVMIGSYLSKDAALDDYKAVRACGAYLHGAILVSKDLAGKLSVEQSDHMVREGAQGLGTLGLIGGLVLPPAIPVTTVFGAALGAILGETLHLLTEGKVEQQAATMIPLGCAALIVAYPRSSATQVKPAVERAVTKVVGEAKGHHVQALRGALAGAQQQMQQMVKTGK